MQTWSITLHGPAGVISSVDTGESQFVIGTETASDVFTVHGDGVTERHAWVWISGAGLQVEDLAGGTLVNGYTITERVQVEYPASVQVGDLTLVIEVKAVQPVAVSPTPSSLDITIPQRAVAKTKASMEVTIPQRTATRSNVQKTVPTACASAEPTAANKAPLTGEYTLVKEIARGGMGQIYFGEDPQLERQVAVKVSSISEDGEDPRFSKEAKVLAQLAHPNIVPIHNIGVDGQGRPFYSMKLVKGRTLQAVLNLIRDGDATATKEYPRATLLTIFRKVCDAMMFAHSKGILHRDLKPENIMVGEYGEVLVMDWGLAKVLGEREEQSSSVSRVNDTGDYGMTMEGEVMGTPQYMSPEQAMGMVAELDQRSDIYSLGGILYAILTLRPPIDGTTLDEVLTKVKNGSISSMMTKRGSKGAVTVGAPTAMGAEVPEALQAVTLKAMARNRDQRYASVDAFAADIESYQNGFATQAEEAGTLKVLILFMKRHKGVSVLAAAFMLAALGFNIRLGIEREQARASEKQAIASQEQSMREAAAAQIALAEAALETGDSEQMREVLAKIPRDLRDQTWDYLNARSDHADLIVRSPDGSKWLGVESIPDNSDGLLACLPNGHFHLVNTDTGHITPLWKAERKGFVLSGFAPSDDGKRVVLVFTRGSLIEVEVRSLAGPNIYSGQAVAVFHDAGKFSNPRLIGDTLLFSQGSHQSPFLRAWDIRFQTPLWEKANILLWEPEKNSGNFVALDNKGILETCSLKDGSAISTSAKLQNRPHGNARSASIVDPKSKVWICSPTSQFWASRCYSISDGKMHWEAQWQFGNPYQAQRNEKSSEIAILSKRSALGSVMELRDAITGRLLRACAFRGEGGRIVANQKAFCAASENRILVWYHLRDAAVATIANGYFSTQILGDSDLVFKSLLTGNQSEMALQQLSADTQKQKVVTRVPWEGFPAGRGGYVSANQEGTRGALHVDQRVGACAIEGEKIRELWPVKTVRSTGCFRLHPTEDILWVGSSILEFSTGRETAVLELGDFEMFSGGIGSLHRRGDWVGAHHLVAPVLNKKTADLDQERKRFLARWDTRSGKLEDHVPAPEFSCLAASPDGKWIAEGGRDKRLRIRDAASLDVQKSFRIHDREVLGVAWHPRLPLVVTASNDGTVKIWSARDWSLVQEIRVEPSSVGVDIPGKRKRLVVSGGQTLVFEPECFQR